MLSDEPSFLIWLASPFFPTHDEDFDVNNVFWIPNDDKWEKLKVLEVAGKVHIPAVQYPFFTNLFTNCNNLFT
jgi:hypothetical protein